MEEQVENDLDDYHQADLHEESLTTHCNTCDKDENMPHPRENDIPWSEILQYDELLYIEDVHRNVIRREMNKHEKVRNLLEQLEQENTKEKGPYFFDNGIIGKTDINKQGQQ